VRIAVNTRLLLSDRLEGIGYYAFEVLRRMVADHPEDTFIFFFDRPFSPAFVFAPNVVPVVLQPPARHPFLWWWWFEIALTKALKTHKADVFFSPEGYLSLRSRVPTLMVIHDIASYHFPENLPFWARHFMNKYVPKYLAHAQHLAAVSAFTVADVLAAYPHISAGKFTVAYNGCRPIFKPISDAEKQVVRDRFSEGAPFFLFVGAVHPRKNVHRLIEAYDIYRGQNAHFSPVKLVIAGRFAWKTGVVRAAYENATFKNDIIFTGYLPENEVAALTAAALAVCYVSLFEGFGVPILEALHCETPVMTSRSSSMPEVAGDAALLVAPENVLEMANGLQKIATDPNFRAQLVENGKKQRLKFDWDDTAKRLYESLRALNKKA
jgi:glycosyltransferase involved in cell wall biosynthesis